MQLESMVRPVKVLVVEDEEEIRGLISMLLRRQGYEVVQCTHAKQAIEKLQTEFVDLVVLDWMMPQMDGIEFLHNLKQFQKHKPAVLMVTARAEPCDIVVGLDSGADDYMTKPFEPSVFLSRTKALLRRVSLQKTNTNPVGRMKIGDIHIDLNAYEVRVGTAPIQLTTSEFTILVEMSKNRGRVMTRENFISVIQGDGFAVTDRVVDNHIYGLRKKLGLSADWIETIRGVGYRVRVD